MFHGSTTSVISYDFVRIWLSKYICITKKWLRFSIAADENFTIKKGLQFKSPFFAVFD